MDAPVEVCHAWQCCAWALPGRLGAGSPVLSILGRSPRDHAVSQSAAVTAADEQDHNLLGGAGSWTEMGDQLQRLLAVPRQVIALHGKSSQAHSTFHFGSPTDLM